MTQDREGFAERKYWAHRAEAEKRAELLAIGDVGLYSKAFRGAVPRRGTGNAAPGMGVGTAN